MTHPAAEAARAVADAVLYEGYLLYPYRASALKNRSRFQFGVLMPPAYADEPSLQRTECLADAPAGTTLSVVVRFLQLQDDTVEREVTHSLPLEAAARVWAFDMGEVAVRVTPLDCPQGGFQVRVEVRNTFPGTAFATRDDALRHAMLGAHTLLEVDSGRFLSLIDPPEWATAVTAQCNNLHTWPVPVGDKDRPRIMLSSPIILPDFPEIAPESPGNWYDSLEIDELLVLRTQTLTDAEKAEARATDPRAAALIDRADAFTPDDLADQLHGRLRRDAQTPRPGTQVTLRPKRRSDAHDMFLEGRRATVAEVRHDVDDQVWLAVTVDDDPAADLYQAQARYLYFAPDEVEVVAGP